MRALLLTLAMVLIAPLAHAIDTTQLPDPVLQARYVKLSHELRCLKCQNETIADSPSDVAADLRRELRELLESGKTDDEIRDYVVARYGEFILFKPRFSGHTLWLWLAPPISMMPGASHNHRVCPEKRGLNRMNSP